MPAHVGPEVVSEAAPHVVVRLLLPPQAVQRQALHRQGFCEGARGLQYDARFKQINHRTLIENPGIVFDGVWTHTISTLCTSGNMLCLTYLIDGMID